MSEVLITPKSDHVRATGLRLRQLIKALGLSYVKAAEDMGISKSHLGNWMRGDNYPGPFELYRFCRRHGVNFDWVFLGDPASLPHRVAERLLTAELAQEAQTDADNQASEVETQA